MKICIVSDSHDRADALRLAIESALAEGAQAVIHCGDVIGPNTLRPLKRIGIPVHVIHGNNVGDTVVLAKMSAEPDSSIHYHGRDARIELAGRRIFVTHYPEYAQAFASTGEWDLVCCGHSHAPEVSLVRNVRGGETPMVNPGTVAGLGAPAATWIWGDLTRLHFEIRKLGAAA